MYSVLWGVEFLGLALFARAAPLKGVAFSPVGFPADYGAGFVGFFQEQGINNKGAVYVNSAWRDNETLSGQVPSTAKVISQSCDTNMCVPVAQFGWRSGSDLLLNTSQHPDNTWNNSNSTNLYIAAAVGYCSQYTAPYVFLGNENDFYFEQDQVDYARWIAAYNQAYDAIKASCPDTLVGPTFQYEHLSGQGQLNNFNSSFWGALTAHNFSKVDVVGLTLYPFWNVTQPSQISPDYLQPLFDTLATTNARTTGPNNFFPIVITETGWPAENLMSFTYNASQAAQVEYVDALFAMPVVDSGNTVLVQWLFLNGMVDDGSNNYKVFGTVSLRNSSGDAYPVYAKWLSANASATLRCSASFPHLNTSTCQNVAHGAKCLPECASGYIRQSNTSLSCLLGAFRTEAYPNCSAASCPPLMPRNGSTGSCTGKFTGQNCSIVCDAGYVFTGPLNQTCIGAGSSAVWEDSQSCVAASCAALSPLNGGAGSCLGNVSTGQSCAITCVDGYRLVGPSTQLCLPSGPGTATFGNNQSCVAVNCTALSPAGGTAGTCDGGKTSGETCSITCNDGYTLSGPSNQSCAPAPGNASYEKTQACVGIPCSPLADPLNGTRGSCNQSKVTGQSCSITCDPGFVITGPATQICMGNNGSSAFPNTQTCTAQGQGTGKVCPHSELKTVFTTCVPGDFPATCSKQCNTVVNWLTTAFKNATSAFAEACVRNANSSYPAATVDYLAGRARDGLEICQGTVNSAISTTMSLLSFVPAALLLAC